MKIFEIAMFIAVILAVVLYRVNKAYRYRKWAEERAKETAKLYRYHYDYATYDTYERVECECGYVATDSKYSGEFIKRRSYYENRICPCCKKRWETVDEHGWWRW
jgi:hypothetical protein